MATIDQNSLLGDQDEYNKPAAQQGAGQSRIANYSTGTPTTQNGSGRFQNLQKYVDANEGAGLNQANRLSNATNRDISAFNADNSAKTNTINQEATQAKSLFELNGKDYTNALKGWQESLATQADILNRGTADTAAQQVKGFTSGTTNVGTNPGSDFQTFQNLQQGAGYDQQKSLDLLTAGVQAGDRTLADIQNKANSIQTEAGRQNLLTQAASPYGPRASMGGNRLNQLLFQANPNAVSALQNQFKTQQTGVQDKVNAFGQLGYNVVNPLIEQEAALQNELVEGSKGLQTQFENNFANQKNYDIVNQGRDAVYAAYVKQLQDGNISSNLGNILGLNDYVAQYNPTLSTSGSVLPGFTGGKMGSVLPGVTPAAQTGQIRTYNALTDDDYVKNYLVQNGAKANSLQDVLSAQDFENYKGFGALSGGPLKVQGSSNLGAVATAAQNVGADGVTRSALLNSIMDQDRNFANNYGGKSVQSSGYVIEGGPGFQLGNQNSGSGSNTYAIGPAQLVQQPVDFNTLLSQAYADTAGMNGTAAFANAVGTIDGAVTGSSTPTVQMPNDSYGKMFDRGGDAEAARSAGTQAYNGSLGNVNTMLNNIINTTGVKNTATMNGTEPTDATYLKLKELGLI